MESTAEPAAPTPYGLARHLLPEHRLHADDLAGLEGFVLARSWFEGPATGLDAFELGNSIRLQRAGGRLKATAGRLRGLTPGGQPVSLDGPGRLEAEVEGEPEAVDLAVVVDPPGRPEKLALEAVAADPHAGPPAARPSRLALGRFAGDGRDWRVVPPPRRLGALRSLPRWESYVAPLTGRLLAAARRAASRETPGDLRPALLGATAGLCFEWAELPVPELARRLAFVRWLAGWNPSAPRLFDGDWGAENALPAGAHGGSAEDLPVRLAALLDACLQPAPAARRLAEGEDFDATPGQGHVAVRFRRDQGRGRLEFRLPPADAPGALLLIGTALHERAAAQPRGGCAAYRSGAVRVDADLTLFVSPLGPAAGAWELWFLR